MNSSKLCAQNVIWEKNTRHISKCDTIIIYSSFKKIKCLYSNGRIAEEGYIKNGIKDSIWKNYDPNGNLLYSEFYFKSGIINKIDFDNSKIVSNIFYKINDSLRAVPLLTHTFYHKDGKTIKEIFNYDTMSIKLVKPYLKSFNEKGFIVFEGFVSNPNDDWSDNDGIFYYYNKKLSIKKIYEDNNLKLTEEKYYKNGKIEYRLTKYKNKLEGEHILYFKNGVMSVYSEFKNGKLDGKLIIYKKNGEIFEESIFKNGVKQN